MNKEKSTTFIFDKKVIENWLNEENEKKISPMDIYNLINKSYNLYDGRKFIFKDYINELARQQKKLKNEENILFYFFDITISLHMLRSEVFNKEDRKKFLDTIVSSMNKIGEDISE